MPPKAPAARTADLIELERAGAERSSSSERSEASDPASLSASVQNEATEEPSSEGPPAARFLSQCEASVIVTLAFPSKKLSSTGCDVMSTDAYAPRSSVVEPSFFPCSALPPRPAPPAGGSTTRETLLSFGSNAPLLLLNMVQICAMSCVVAAVREREPSTADSSSTMGNGSLAVRRVPRFQTSTRLPSTSMPSRLTLMSCARK
mmetsp:Transcript_12372/g.41035  ORF Transcript_12372/g.41035 Transcript_12372/m.41035 type:complete len:204 (-) Transcript_12372:102-713(-)